MRKALLLILFIGLLTTANSFGSFAKGKKEFSFVFMTDIHLQPEKNATEGFLKAIDKINELNPDFVITGGDLIMDALGQTYSRSDSLYKLYEATTSNLNMPIFNTIGNHDVFGLYKKSGVDSTHPEYGKKMFEKRHSDRYKSFEHKGWHFISLDAIGFTNDRHYYGYIDSVQVEWLKNEFDKIGKEKPIVISTHIPLLSICRQVMDGPTEAFGEGSIITNAQEITKILEEYNVKIVLQGHLHFLEDILYNGIHYVTGGAVCANWWKGPRFGMEEGFLYVKIKKEDFGWEYIDYEWEVE